MKILVVDDDKDVSTLLVRYLEEQGHSVISADNGHDGLDAALGHAVDLIILDRQLPENVDGVYLLKILRADHNQTPVLILSGQSSVLNHIEGFRAGTDDYLTKPFTLQQLDASINAIVKARSELPSA